MQYCNFHIMTVYESDAVCGPLFQMTAVLTPVHNIRTFVRRDELVFEAHGTPTVTHTMVSASLPCRQFDSCSMCSAVGRPLRTISDHQTLRVCGDIVRDPFGHPCCATCQLTKRSVCAASALPLVKAGADSLRSWPPGGACPNLSDHQTLRVCGQIV